MNGIIQEKISTIKLTSSERSLVSFLLSHPEIVSSIKLNDLAKLSYVSGPTISRFVKKLGFKNYNDFRVTFVKELSSKDYQDTKINYDLPIQEGMSIFDIKSTIAIMMHTIIDETISINEQDSITYATELILKAKNIKIYGSFTYLPFSNSFKYNMERIGKHVEIMNNEGQFRFSALRTNADDLSILISYSGSMISENLGGLIIPVLKSNNSPIIAITSYGNKTLNVSDYNAILYMPSRQHKEVYFSPMTGELSLYLLFYILYACAYESNFNSNLNYIKSSLNKSKLMHP